MTATELIERWRGQALILRLHRRQRDARWLLDRATELEEALGSGDSRLVGLTEAGRISGYSADHLGRLIRQGKLTSHGRPNAPRVRVSDLPRKAYLTRRDDGTQIPGASRRQIAQAILTSDR